MNFLLFCNFKKYFFRVNLFAICALCDPGVELGSLRLSCCWEGFCRVCLFGRFHLCKNFMTCDIANEGQWCFESS